jgi:hypothetical protein
MAGPVGAEAGAADLGAGTTSGLMKRLRIRPSAYIVVY